MIRSSIRSELLGSAIGPREQFPLLVKFIDANQDLSVQVHPDDEKGRRLADDNGKTETWVILARRAGQPHLCRACGPGVQARRSSRRQRLPTSDKVEPLLHRFEARPGDSVLIEAGTVHAIGAGVLLAEIQQMSDATFRVFDWNRVGPDGKPRQLHTRTGDGNDRLPSRPRQPAHALIEEPIDAVGTRERL